MNKVILIGRLTKDVEISEGKKAIVGHYTLAIDNGKDYDTSFIRCTLFGKSAEFAEKYFSKGLRVAVEGRIQTGSYDDKDGFMHYTTDVIVERQEFADGKKEEDSRSKGRRR